MKGDGDINASSFEDDSGDFFGDESTTEDKPAESTESTPTEDAATTEGADTAESTDTAEGTTEAEATPSADETTAADGDVSVDDDEGTLPPTFDNTSRRRLNEAKKPKKKLTEVERQVREHDRRT